MEGLRIDFTDIRPGFVKTELLKQTNYPMLMTVPPVSRSIVKAIKKRKHTVTIDWRYRVLVGFWRLIPRWLWIKLKVR
jgi:short-subunit dehydrogenase